MASISSRPQWVKLDNGTCSARCPTYHYRYVIMGAVASQITRRTIVYSTVYSGADQRKYQSSASLTFVRGIHRWPVNSPHKWPVTRKMISFNDVIMLIELLHDETIRYAVNRVIVRSLKILKPLDWAFGWSYHSDICAAWQDVFQISERSNHFFHGIDISQDLTLSFLNTWWI